MDEDILPRLSVSKAKPAFPTKSKIVPELTSFSDAMKDQEEVGKPRPLTTKAAVEYLLEGTLKSKVCRYCLNVTPGLAELDQVMKIAGSSNLYKVTIRDIVASFHPFKVVDDPNFPDKICQKCVDRALAAYLFTQQCERAERAMLNCFDDMYEKLIKLDPIERPKKRGRQKLNPNYNTLHAEYYEVIDYAEPIINIINVGAETSTKEPAINDLECKKCCQVLPNLESLLNHEKLHPKTMWYNCRLCGKSFPKRSHLKKHHHRAHVLGKEVQPIIDNNFKCKECDHITDSYVTHLQHVEKHKFTNVMEHLIEKRMDRLCVVCFNQSRKLTDLDQMVCIHGGHPDLMGDKTLYTLLASTLPNPKSYKYQELYIPSEAQVMAINKRQTSYDTKKSLIKKFKPNIDNINKKNFEFSYPFVVSKDRFKTDSFYYYVYTDPEYQNDVIICESVINYAKEFGNIHTAPAKAVEVIKIEEIEIEMSNKSDIPQESYKRSDNVDGTNILKDLKEVPNTEHAKATKCDNLNAQLTLNNNSHNDIAKYTDNTINNISQKINTKLDNIENKNEPIKHGIKENTAKNNDYYDLKSNCDIYWVFNKTSDGNLKQHKLTKKVGTLGEKKTECKFCWVFEKTNKCEYCKKTNIDIYDGNKQIAASVQSSKDEIKEIKNKDINKQKFTEIWLCNICLTNNNGDRLSCHCCGTAKITEYNEVKIKFCNKTFDFKQPTKVESVPEDFVQTVDTVNIEPKRTEKEITIVEEPCIIDCKANCEDNITTEMNNNIENMETEIFIIKDQDIMMEIEENPISLTQSFKWDNSLIPQFNVGQVPSNIGPTIGSNPQFNIGFAPEQKPRKFKRAIRNVKALHK